MSNDSIEIDFMGIKVAAIHRKDGIWVPITPMCRQLGLDDSWQHRRLRESSWCVLSKIDRTGAKGNNFKQLCIEHVCLPNWMNRLQESKLRPEHLEAVKRIQIEGMYALAKHFYGEEHVKSLPSAQAIVPALSSEVVTQAIVSAPSTDEKVAQLLNEAARAFQNNNKEHEAILAVVLAAQERGDKNTKRSKPMFVR